MQQRAPYLVLPGRAAVPMLPKKGAPAGEPRSQGVTYHMLQPPGSRPGFLMRPVLCQQEKRERKKDERSQNLIGKSIENMVRISLHQKNSSTLQYCFNILFFIS